MKPPILLFFSLFWICWACDPAPSTSPKNSARELSKVDDLAGFLDGSHGVLHVRPEDRVAVLEALGAERVTTDSVERHQIVHQDSALSFIVLGSLQPWVFAPEHSVGMREEEWPYGPFIRIWKNAACSRKVAGFRFGCIGAFPPYNRFGNSMDWGVNPYQQCASGTGYCVEVYQPVGTITVYNGFDCSDTLTTTFPILQYRCN